MIRAILFDSDGVLIDSERLFFDATCCAFRRVDLELTAAQWAKWFLAEGRRTLEIAMLLGLARSKTDALIANRNELFWRLVDRSVPVFPGIREMLIDLAPHYRMAIVTGASREHFERVHQKTGLLDFFELAVTQDDYEAAKPSPQAYLIAMAKLALKPEECIAVEDSPRGASAAVAAGLRCFVVPTFLTDVSLCPDGCLIMENIAGLKEKIDLGSARRTDWNSCMQRENSVRRPGPAH